MIRLEKLTKKFGAATAIENLSLDLSEGLVHVFIGPSGCGKSTLLRLIAGVIAPTSGRVFVGNNDIALLRPQLMAQNIGYVIQEGGLFPHLTVRGNLSIGPRKALTDDVEQLDMRMNELLTTVQLSPDYLERYPSQLSGGQRQRIALMRALMHDPAFLLMDEPLGALDPLVRRDLQRRLKDIFKLLGKTVIFVTHDLQEAAMLGDKLYVMDAGQVIQSGTFEDLIQCPKNEFVRKFVMAQRPSEELLELWR